MGLRREQGLESIWHTSSVHRTYLKIRCDSYHRDARKAEGSKFLRLTNQPRLIGKLKVSEKASMSKHYHHHHHHTKPFKMVL